MSYRKANAFGCTFTSHGHYAQQRPLDFCDHLSVVFGVDFTYLNYPYAPGEPDITKKNVP